MWTHSVGIDIFIIQVNLNLEWIVEYVMLSLHLITTNLRPIYELKNYRFLRLVSSRSTFVVRSQASVYIDVEERLTYE